MRCLDLDENCPTMNVSFAERDRMDWDDLRVVAAVGEAGSLSGAGRRLGVSHATVFRRLKALEAQLAVRLFDRSPEGYVPTPAGDEMIAAAVRAGEAVATA